MNIQDSNPRVHYGLVRQEISSEVVLPPENITSFDLRLFKIFKAVGTRDDTSEQ